MLEHRWENVLILTRSMLQIDDLLYFYYKIR